MKLRPGPTAAAAALSLAWVALLWVTAPAMGFTRDEGYYFKAAEEYAGWWGVLFSSRFLEAFGDAEIRRFFSYNWEHPALVKLTQGATFHLLHGLLGVASPSQGFRATGFLFGGLALFSTYLLGRELAAPRVGLVAALMMATMPRFFHDAHLACFDVPITAMWTLSLVTFVRALRAPPGAVARRAVVAGLVFGLALATKLNALFLPFVFVALWLVDPSTPKLPALAPAPSGGVDVALPPVPWALVAAAVLGPLVFVAHWPYLWHDTFARIGQYVAFHLHHEHYPASYFFDVLVKPPFPWSFPVVMSAITVPSPVLSLGVLGLLVALARAARRSVPDAALVLAAALPVFLIALPSTPIFGGVKHWYNALPAFAVLAARALWWGLDLVAARPGPLPRLATAVVLALAVAPGALGVARSHPNGIGFYNELAGGFAGGARLGMQRGFWGGLAGPLYPGLADLDPPARRVFFNRTNHDSVRMYQREGVVPRTIGNAADVRTADVSVVFEQPEHGEQEAATWALFGTRPIAGVYQDEVTLVQLYQRGPSSRPPPEAEPPAR